MIGQRSENVQRLDAEMNECQTICVGGGILRGQILE
jgi:hypothetical protein